MSAIILCATDLDTQGSNTAVSWASAWAQSCGGQLVLLHVDGDAHPDLSFIPKSVAPGAATMAARLDLRRQQHQDALDRLVDSLPVDATTRVEMGRPWEVIEAVADELDCALIVVGPHERGLGSTARRVVTHASRPVLVARGEAPPTLEGLTWTVGLAPDEPSRGDQPNLLQRIETLAKVTGGDMVLVRALPVLATMMPEAEAVDPTSLTAALVDAADKVLRKLAESAEVPTEVVVEVGPPHHVLTSVAQKHGGILAVAAHTRGVIERLFIGSVSERCLRHAKGPVYVERAE